MTIFSLFWISFSAFVLSLCLVNAQNCKDDIAEIRETLVRQNGRMERLELENGDLQKENGALKDEISNLKDIVSQLSHAQETVKDTKQTSRRLLLPQTDGSITPVAFYAYMSSDEAASSAHFTLKFNIVKTNVGNGYNSHSGTFVAPVAGTYVFAYTICSNIRGAIWLNIFVNEEAYGGTLSDTQENGDYDSEATTIVANLKQGDSVNIRTTEASTASIKSGRDLHTTFAGWRIF